MSVLTNRAVEQFGKAVLQGLHDEDRFALARLEWIGKAMDMLEEAKKATADKAAHNNQGPLQGEIEAAICGTNCGSAGPACSRKGESPIGSAL